jgi:hypothetical protein
MLIDAPTRSPARVNERRAMARRSRTRRQLTCAVLLTVTVCPLLDGGRLATRDKAGTGAGALPRMAVDD